VSYYEGKRKGRAEGKCSKKEWEGLQQSNMEELRPGRKKGKGSLVGGLKV